MKKLYSAFLLPLAIATGCGGDGLPNRVGSISIDTIQNADVTRIENIVINNDIAYLKEDAGIRYDYGDGYHRYKLHTVNVSDPANPTSIGQSAAGNDSPDLPYYHEGFLHFILNEEGGSSKLMTADVNDPTQPNVQNSNASYTLPRNLTLANDRLYITDSEGLNIFSLQDPAYPILENTLLPGSFNLAVSSDSNRIFVSEIYNKKLITFDATNPDYPTVEAEYTFPERIIPRALSNHLYVSFPDRNGLSIYDFSDPAEPAYLSSLNFIGQHFFYEVTPNRIYIADEAGLYTINTSDKNNPLIMGLELLEARPTSLALEGNYLYIGMEGGTLAIYRR